MSSETFWINLRVPRVHDCFYIDRSLKDQLLDPGWPGTAAAKGICRSFLMGAGVHTVFRIQEQTGVFIGKREKEQLEANPRNNMLDKFARHETNLSSEKLFNVLSMMNLSDLNSASSPEDRKWHALLYATCRSKQALEDLLDPGSWSGRDWEGSARTDAFPFFTEIHHGSHRPLKETCNDKTLSVVGMISLAVLASVSVPGYLAHDPRPLDREMLVALTPEIRKLVHKRLWLAGDACRELYKVFPTAHSSFWNRAGNYFYALQKQTTDGWEPGEHLNRDLWHDLRGKLGLDFDRWGRIAGEIDAEFLEDMLQRNWGSAWAATYHSLPFASG